MTDADTWTTFTNHIRNIPDGDKVRCMGCLYWTRVGDTVPTVDGSWLCKECVK